MTAHYLRLVGLVVAFVGTLVLARGEILSGFARIRWWCDQHPDKSLPGGSFKQLVFRMARRWGSKDPFAGQAFDVDSVPTRVVGLLLLALGFAFQTAAVLVALFAGTVGTR